MGNWKTVNIVGSCGKEDVQKLKGALFTPDFNDWHCFSFSETGSLCGLGDWASEDINAIGNLSERDYSVEDVADTLRMLVKQAPSLDIKVHCGGDYESLDCEATVVVKNGKVRIQKPQVEKIMKISDDQILGRLHSILQ